MNKIITLDDIFKNLETEEKAFKFKDYIIDMQEEVERLHSIIKEVREYIEYQLENLDFEEDTKAKMLGAMVLVLLDKENNNEDN